MQLARLFCALIALTIWSSGYAKERIALVIGNANYASLALANSVNDAEDMASTLESLSFSVTLVKDASQDRAPSFNKYVFRTQLIGTVNPFTKITALPIPFEASTFLDIAKNEHIPKK